MHLNEYQQAALRTAAPKDKPNEVFHLLLGIRPVATHDRVFLLDIRTLELRSEAVSREADCPVCGVLARNDADG